MKKLQNGFSVVEGLLIILILSVIGFGGYYVWDTQQDKEANNNYQTTPTATPSPTPAKSTKKYLTIKEWSVRVSMPNNVDVNDLEYNIRTVDSNSNQADIGSKKLSAVEPACDVTKGDGTTPFGGIERMTASAYKEASAKPEDTGVDNGTLLGSYYYVWQTSRANCAKTAEANQLRTSLLENFPEDMPKVLQNIEVIPES